MAVSVATLEHRYRAVKVMTITTTGHREDDKRPPRQRRCRQERKLLAPFGGRPGGVQSVASALLPARREAHNEIISHAVRPTAIAASRGLLADAGNLDCNQRSTTEQARENFYLTHPIPFLSRSEVMMAEINFGSVRLIATMSNSSADRVY